MQNQNGGLEDRFWSSGIEDMTSIAYNKNVKADPKAEKIISDALHTIFTRIILNLKEKNPANISEAEIQEVIQNLLPSSMADHAMAEGFRKIFSWGLKPYYFTQKEKLNQKYATQLEKIKEQHETGLKHSLKASVTKLMKKSHSDGRLDKDSNLYVCYILDSILDAIIKKLNERNIDKLTLNEARKITEEIFPKELSLHAAAEGNKMLFKFESRGLRFAPGALAHQEVQEIVSSKKEAKKSATNEKDFKSGVTLILKQTHNDLAFNPSGQRMICRNLGSLCDMILEKSGEKDTKKTQEDIHNAVRSVLPPIMAEHAIAEAEKMISRHEKGDFGELVFHDVGGGKVVAQKHEGMGLNLEDGVVAMSKETHPKARLNQGAIDFISTDINDLLNILIKKVKESEVENVTLDDIKKAVDAIIVPASLNEHANSEGDNKVALHEKVIFLPKKRKI